MKFRSIVIVIAASAAFVYITAALIGVSQVPKPGTPLDTERTTHALSTAFPDVPRWTQARGETLRTRLVRRAFVEGGDTTTGHRYTEQILKVGWPFTVVRGFDRRSDAPHDTATSPGVGWTADTPLGQARRLLPLQPIWPGMIAWTVTLAALAVLAMYVRYKSNGSRQSVPTTRLTLPSTA